MRGSSILNLIKPIYQINKKPLPWERAIKAAICAGTPVIVGLLLGQLRLGMLGGVGSFTYLYVFNEPYAFRLKKIFFVALSISLLVGLGSLVAPYPELIVIIVGLIGFTATYIFGVQKIIGPAAIFLVLSFVMSTISIVPVSEIPIRMFVVFLSGCFALFVSMIGYFSNPHGSETKVLSDAYASLVDFSKSIGSKDVTNSRDLSINAVKLSESTLSIGYIKGKNESRYSRLVLITKGSSRILLELLEISFYKKEKIPREISEMINELSKGIKIVNGEVQRVHLKKIYNKDYENLLSIIYEIEDLINTPLKDVEIVDRPERHSLKMKLIKSFDKDSIVFINSVRYGVILSMASLISLSFPFTRPYWIPLSCASVMLGSTIMSTFHRAVQRSLGTIIGIIIASIILSLQPKGFMIAILTMIFVGVAELVIVRNYALVAMVITPNSLLLAETSTNIHNVSYFATGRIIDILVGALIALVGVYIIGRKSASSRLPGLISKLVRSECQVLVRLASNRDGNINDTRWISEKMEINLSNLKLAYATALGEIPNNKEKLDMLWPVISSLEHISYLFSKDCEIGYLKLSDKELSELLLVFETMATSIEQKREVEIKVVPSVKEIPKVCEELVNLQNVLSRKRVFV